LYGKGAVLSRRGTAKKPIPSEGFAIGRDRNYRTHGVRHPFRQPFSRRRWLGFMGRQSRTSGSLPEGYSKKAHPERRFCDGQGPGLPNARRSAPLPPAIQPSPMAWLHGASVANLRFSPGGVQQKSPSRNGMGFFGICDHFRCQIPVAP